MGIVVTIAMLVGLSVFLLNPLSIFRRQPSENPKIIVFVGSFLLVAGLWNAFWHGLQNLDVFWGKAALGSGFFMIVSALVILMSLRQPDKVVEHRWFHYLFIIGLLVSFLLYAVTLVQIYSGMEIIS